MGGGHIELPVPVCVCMGVLVHACMCPILVKSITSTFIMDFTHFTHLFFLTSTSIMQRVCFGMSNVKVRVKGQMFKVTLSGVYLLHLSVDFKNILHKCSPKQVLVSCEEFVSIRRISRSQLKIECLN